MSKSRATIKNLKIILILPSIFYFLFSIPLIAQSQEVDNQLANFIQNTPLVNAPLVNIVFNVIRYLLGFLGVVAVIILIYGGFLWMTARGNEEQVQKAKKTIINGLIGLIIVMLSFAIVQFVIGPLLRGGVGGGGGPGGGGGGGGLPSSQYLNLIWKSPENLATNVSLCKFIQAGFNLPLDATSVIPGTTVKLTILNGANNGASCDENRDCRSGRCTDGHCVGNFVELRCPTGLPCVVGNTFSFAHDDFERETTYQVEIVGGSSGIKSIAPVRYLNGSRTWTFTTGTEGDPIPPTVVATSPTGNDVYLTCPLQARFSEEMNVVGLCFRNQSPPPPFRSFTLTNYSGDFNCFIPNPFSFSAGPKTPYFHQTSHTATLKGNVIQDACGNLLDGNEDGTGGDDYSWNFTTTPNPANQACEPTITSISGDPYYEGNITISGNNFGVTGNIIFHQNVFTDNNCLNTDHFPAARCQQSWSPTSTVTKIPASGGDSEGAVSGNVFVQTSSLSNPYLFEIRSPYVNSFSPTRGGQGQGITIYGKNFGPYNANESKVYFIRIAGGNVTSTPAELPCGPSGWQNNFIVIKVPNNLSAGTYYLQVKNQIDGTDRYSNLRFDQPFIFDPNLTTGPILCDITPHCFNGQIGGKKDDSRTLSGQGFAVTDKIYFDSLEISPSSTTSTTAHLITVPNLSPKTYSVKIKNAAGRDSNPLNFISPCFPQGNVGAACFLSQNPNTCGPDEMCLSPYKCVGDTTSSPNECRCCCTTAGGCPAGLTCDLNQTCYKNQTTGIEIKGRCCGCQNSNQCPVNEICKNNCCYACGATDNGQPCHGGECCTIDTNNDNTPDTSICCQGRCVNHQCLTLCGNGQINPGEQCDGNALGGKTCQLLGFAGGTLACNPDCTFDTTGCLPIGQAGNWGDVCQNPALGCASGAVNCSLASGASCVRNDLSAPCACCCRPDDPDTAVNEETCLYNLTCDITKNCSYTSPPQKGRCCGCGGPTGDDDGKCCGNPGGDCFGMACKDNCCLPFPAPTNLQIIYPTVNQIKLTWQYSDPENLATHFEIWRKIGGGNYSLLTTCRIDNLSCNPNPDNKFSLTRLGNTYTFIDQTGNFDRTQAYFFKVRAKKGSTTAYSDYTDEVSGTPTGVFACRNNNDCPDTTPCCRGDTKQCVTWDLCPTGQCTEDNRCHPPEAKFALADFWVESPPAIAGPCLIKVQPTQGYRKGTPSPPGETLVNLKGLDFGSTQGTSQVLFNNTDADYTSLSPNAFLWSDQEIKNVRISSATPLDTPTLREVKVKKVINNDIKYSNSRTFIVLKTQGDPGQSCKNQNISACTTGFDQCWNPPNYTTYSCLVSANDCRCCCNPQATTISEKCPSPLVCVAGMGNCTGSNRGLCCGCSNDNQCGSNQGCGLLDPHKCCYSRPTASLSTCRENNQIGLNTTIEINFSTLMDVSRLNSDYIKIWRSGNCDSVQEGTYNASENRCYLNGQFLVGDLREGGEGFSAQPRTIVTFYPSLCRLKPNTTYTIKIIGGVNGGGVRSRLGISMDDFEGQLITGPANNLCHIEWIDVQPREVVVRDTNVATNFYAYARDNDNRSVCLENFQWKSSNQKVATVTSPGLSTTATSQSFGETKIVAEISALDKTCDTIPNHTCGLLRVSLAGPRVIENQNCAICAEGGQSPSPFKNSTNACRNALIVAKFNREINTVNLDLPNVFIVEVGQNDSFNNPGSFSEVDGSLHSIFDNNRVIGFYFKPSSLLIANRIYRVTLKSGTNGIKDINGLQLDGNKNGVQDGSPADDYVWYFKTGSEETCSLNKVCLQPSTAKITHPGMQSFKGEVYTNNCNYLDPAGYSWEWRSENPTVATVPTNITGANVTSTSVSLGETKIKGSAGGKEDKARLIVATRPTVLEQYPLNQDNICRNTAIKVVFDQLMDHSSLNKNTIKLSIGQTTPCLQTGQNVLRKWLSSVLKNKITILFSKIFLQETKAQFTASPCPKVTNWCEVTNYQIENRDILATTNSPARTETYLKLNGILEPRTCYKVEIIGGENGVKSRAPYTETMASGVSWQFKTSSEICLLDQVVVDADTTQNNIQNRRLFREVESAQFQAIPLTRNGQAIQEISGSYEWTWSWSSSDTSVARVTNSDSQNQTVSVATPPKNGSATIAAKATINSNLPNVPSGEKSGSALAEVFLCENPWPCTDINNCQSYRDTTTNFEFKYCRDAGLAGIDGDLPILKGGPIPGAQESNIPSKLKEYLFSVYDGSLSLYYDGEKVTTGQTATTGETATTYEIVVTVKVPDRSGYNNPDYSIYDNSATIDGNVESVEGGKFQNALQFSNNSYLKVDRNITLEPQNLTLAVWTKGGTGSSSNCYLFQKGDTTATGQGYNLMIDTNNKIHFWIYDKNGQKKEVVSSDSVNRNDWQHIAATYDGQSLRIYLNGVLKGSLAPVNGLVHKAVNLKIGGGCKLLDEIALYSRALSQPEIEKLTRGPVQSKIGDVIGLKVFSNFDHLRPEEWFREYATGQTGAGSSSIVDGYSAYKVGRTIYVGAANVSDSNIYSNIYLISHSDNAQSETLNIFNQLVNNWKFNINITPEENKAKLSRDLERFYHLNDLALLFERYKTEKGYYPKLESGSYIAGMTTSKWPSWNRDPAFNLTKELGGHLPVDPVNKFANKTCGTAPNQYSCCADCPRDNPQCDETCYNPETKVYECNPDSNIYQYMAENNGQSYSFYTKFEYTSPNQWQHNCSDLNQSSCRTRHWCEWVGTEPNCACRAKNLNYSSNDQRTKCFNTQYQPAGFCLPKQTQD